MRLEYMSGSVQPKLDIPASPSRNKAELQGRNNVALNSMNSIESSSRAKDDLGKLEDRCENPPAVRKNGLNGVANKKSQRASSKREPQFQPLTNGIKPEVREEEEMEKEKIRALKENFERPAEGPCLPVEDLVPSTCLHGSLPCEHLPEHEEGMKRAEALRELLYNLEITMKAGAPFSAAVKAFVIEPKNAPIIDEHLVACALAQAADSTDGDIRMAQVLVSVAMALQVAIGRTEEFARVVDSALRGAFISPVPAWYRQWHISTVSICSERDVLVYINERIPCSCLKERTKRACLALGKSSKRRERNQFSAPPPVRVNESSEGLQRGLSLQGNSSAPDLTGPVQRPSRAQLQTAMRKGASHSNVVGANRPRARDAGRRSRSVSRERAPPTIMEPLQESFTTPTTKSRRKLTKTSSSSCSNLVGSAEGSQRPAILAAPSSRGSTRRADSEPHERTKASSQRQLDKSSASCSNLGSAPDATLAETKEQLLKGTRQQRLRGSGKASGRSDRKLRVSASCSNLSNASMPPVSEIDDHVDQSPLTLTSGQPEARRTSHDKLSRYSSGTDAPPQPQSDCPKKRRGVGSYLSYFTKRLSSRKGLDGGQSRRGLDKSSQSCTNLVSPSAATSRGRPERGPSSSSLDLPPRGQTARLQAESALSSQRHLQQREKSEGLRSNHRSARTISKSSSFSTLGTSPEAFSDKSNPSRTSDPEHRRPMSKGYSMSKLDNAAKPSESAPSQRLSKGRSLSNLNSQRQTGGVASTPQRQLDRVSVSERRISSSYAGSPQLEAIPERKMFSESSATSLQRRQLHSMATQPSYSNRRSDSDVAHDRKHKQAMKHKYFGKKPELSNPGIMKDRHLKMERPKNGKSSRSPFW